MKTRINRNLSILTALSLLVLMSSAQAAPQVELQFESMFGQHGFFQNGAPPNGFISPTGVSFIANDDILVADQGNQQVQIGTNQSTGYHNGLKK